MCDNVLYHAYNNYGPRLTICGPNPAWGKRICAGQVCCPPLQARDRGERYANNILWISFLGMILKSWDVTEKKTYRDGGLLYRSK